MSKIEKILAGVILIAIVIAVGGYFYPQFQFGGTTNYDTLDVSDGYQVDGTTVIDGSGQLIIGTNGSTFAELKVTTCDITTGGATVTATSTILMDCAVTGVTSGDIVFASFGTSTKKLSAGWEIIGADASTTAGWVTLVIRNLTGVDAVVPRDLASTTKIMYADI